MAMMTNAADQMKKVEIARRLAEDDEIKRAISEIEEQRNESEEESLKEINVAFPPETSKSVHSSRFTSTHLEKACRIIEAIRNPECKYERPSFNDDQERLLTYDLIFSVFKYAEFINQALEVSGFYEKFKKEVDGKGIEVMVVAYDLLERNFHIEAPDETIFGKLRKYIMNVKVKFLAHLAKIRIGTGATTIEKLLPDYLHNKKQAQQCPLYAWINLKKTSTNVMKSALKDKGLVEAVAEDDILIQPNAFYIISSHPNLIRFHSSKTKFLSDFLTNGQLVIQDKSACLYVYSLVKALYFKELLSRSSAQRSQISEKVEGSLRGEFKLNRSSSLMRSIENNTNLPEESWYDNILDDVDKHNELLGNTVIVTHCGSGRSIANLAVLLQEAVPKWLTKKGDLGIEYDLAGTINNKFTRRPPLKVIAFGTNPQKIGEITNFIGKQLGIKNVKIYTEDFLNINLEDKRLKGTVAVLVNPPSSGSALNDPVQYICAEGGDEQVLAELSNCMKDFSDKSKATLASSEASTSNKTKEISALGKYLKHALSIKKTKLILYTTFSLLKSENYDIVHSTLEDVRREQEIKKLETIAELVAKASIRSYKDITFELVQMKHILNDYHTTSFNGPFMELSPSSTCSGCFIALVRRKEKAVYVTKTISKSSPSASFDSKNSENHLNNLEHILRASNGKFSQFDLSKFFRERGASESIFSSSSLLSSVSENEEIVFSIGTVDSNLNSNKTEEKKGKKSTRKEILQRLTVSTRSTEAKKTEKWRPKTRPRTAFI